MFKIYTPQDVNKTIPDIERRIKQLLFQKNHVVSLQEDLQRIIEAGSPFIEFFNKKQELNIAVSSLYRSIEQVEERGVMLCWKMGEREVKFWHKKDAGCAGRKPLSPHGLSKVETQDDLSDLR